ncbi:MAG TPA: AMIN domain-containing protein, partial [Pseudoxanthomonas sp.]|nr:AMIN domain-containing protein [Pseudoxanthomonas sp.]
MTASNAHSPLPFRRLATLRACSLGLAIGLLAVTGASSAAPPLPAVPVGHADPAKQIPGALEVASIDFKRGDGGAGRLIVRFNGKGAMPDLRNQGSNVVVDVGNAVLPAALQRPMNVVDFATPVQRVDAHSAGAGTQVVLSTNGLFESLAYQTGNEYVVEIVPRAAQS